jgi:hypothetical protein
MFENDHFQNCVYFSSWKKIQKGYIKFNHVVCLPDMGSSCHVSVMGSLIVLVNKRADWNVPVSYIQGLKLRKYFRGQVGPHQINFGSPHIFLGAHQVRIALLPPRWRGALRQGVRGLDPPWDKWCKILHSGHFLAAKLAIQKLTSYKLLHHMSKL